MTYQSRVLFVIAALFIVAFGSMVLLVSGSNAGTSGGGESEFTSEAPPRAVKQTDEGFVPVSENEMSQGTLEDATRELQPYAMERWPDEFAGMWIKDGKFEDGVWVAFTGDAEARVQELAEETGYSWPELLHPVEAESSLGYLKSVQEQIVKERTETQEGIEGADAPNEGRFDVKVDIKTSKVIVVAEEASPETKRFFADKYGSSVVVEQGPIAVPKACLSRRRCGLALRGGLAARADANYYADNCSTGFTVVSNNALRMLSAGHCSNSTGENRYHGLNAPVWFGSVQNRMMYGPVDAEISSFQNTFTGYPWVFRTQTDQQFPMTSVRPGNLTMTGQTVCKLGITTGRSCGQITYLYDAPWYIPNAVGFIDADVCNDYGDSGASVISNHEAVGILSGGTDGTCQSPVKSTMVFGHIAWALGAMNSSLLVAS